MFQRKPNQTKNAFGKGDASDPEGKWKMCSCNDIECMCCEAEIQAIISAKRWFERLDMENAYNELKQEKEVLARKLDWTLRYGDILRVHCSVDEKYFLTGSTAKFVIKLHKSLSATGMPNYSPRPNACGLITFDFAEKVLRNPYLPIKSFIDDNPANGTLPPLAYQMLSSSIQDGINLYCANYGKRFVKLDVNDITMITSHLEYQIKEEQEINSETIVYTLASKIMSLQKEEIILLFRWNDYNVWAITNFHGTHNVLIYDSHSHTTHNQNPASPVEYGGFLYQIAKTYWVIIDTLTLLEVDCGKLEGPCRIVVLHK